MSPVVEKLNPRKPSALSIKRDAQRGNKRGRTVAISEITLDEVRDDAVKFGLATEVHYQLNAGKEASIYLANWKDFPLILKAYRFWQSAQAKKGKGFFAPGRMQAIAAMEYDILLACFHAGMNVPTPVGRVGNYLTMRYIGDGVEPAPQLRSVHLEEPDLILDEILDDYLIMYRDVNYVHGDLSAYNILWWQGRAWIIDMPQAYKVDTWCDMKRVRTLLRRDIVNLLQYFKKYGIRRDPDEIVKVFLSEYIPHNMRNYEETVAGGS